MLRPKMHILWSGLLALAMIASACAPAATQAPATAAPQPTQAQATAVPQPTTAPETTGPWVLPTFPEPEAVTGDIVTAGSSTVFPLSERMAEKFEQEGYAGSVTIDSIGTGAGFERFCTTGESDIANASRPINARELAACSAIGREPLEFRVGTDALAVVVSANNTFVDYLTLKELAAAFTAKTWAEVRAGWPNEPIQRFSPGTDSGTFDYFVEVVMAPAYPVDGRPNVAAGKKAMLEAAGTQYSEDDNVLVQGVEASQYAIGYFGYAYFAAEAGKLKAVPISKTDKAEDAVAPSEESVNKTTYPLARPLFIYSDPKIIREKPQVGAFIYFYLKNVAAEITDVGYFPAPQDVINKAYGRLLLAAGGIEVDGSAVTGNIVTAGSSTVFPLSERMAEKFQQEGYTGNITVDSIGSGAGFERFCKAGESDIANASRPIRQEEKDNCKAIGRTPLEFRVGTDALAVVVAQSNTFVDYLTLDELAAAFSTAKTWADVRAGWPNEPIQRFSPGTDSGTFDYFIEAVMAPANKVDGKANVEAGKKAMLEAAGTQYSEDDNVLVQGVEASQYAIGYFGYAYYAAEAGRLKAVPIVPAKVAEAAAGDAAKLAAGAVKPDVASVNAGTYPLARPLFIYSDPKILQEKPQVAAFILFYLSQVNEEILDVGYFPASLNQLGDGLGNWLSALGLGL